MQKTTRNATLLGVGLGISAFVGWLFLRENKRVAKSDMVVKSRLPEEAAISEIPLPLEALDDEDSAPPSPEGEDNLTEIRGIGPNYADALHAIGITRFEQLARETPEALANRLADYATVGPQRIREYDWIGQAARKLQR